MDRNEQINEQVQMMQPRKGALILLIPIVFIFLAFVAFFGMIGLGIWGRTADGERVTLTWASCPEARSVVEHRVQGMGLGEPVFSNTPDGFTVTMTLPSDPIIAAQIPTTLAQPGILSASRQDAPSSVVLTNEHISSAAMRQDLQLTPYTVLTLTEAGQHRLEAFVEEQKEGKLVYTLDGTEIAVMSNLMGAGPEVEFTPTDTLDARVRMQRAAERTILLDSGPLPCPITAK